ncbi:MAG: TRAP transporter large permease [Oscillospiraceae bacterium]|nr:TRAP transporter large permease [Oscillospiraceae bacterium]
MSDLAIGLSGIAVVIILVFIRMQVGFAMIVVSLLGLWFLQGGTFALNIAGLIPYGQSVSYTLACMPLFIFMGIVISESGLGADLYNFAANWLCRIKGGLPMATCAACGFFAAICGDSVTTAVTMGQVSYPQMKRLGYKDALSSSVIACGGTVGILIPPSICMIVYGTMTETSIGSLFLAGFIPGILQVLFYIFTIAIVVRLKKDLSPPPFKSTMREKLRSTKSVWPVILIFLVIVFGMYGGIFTPTEAGACGAFATVVVCFLMRRLNKRSFLFSMLDSIRNTSMCFFILIGAFVFNRFMTMSNLPNIFGAYIAELNVPRYVILLLIILMYLVMGAFMDVFATLLLTLPIIFPVVRALGYDAVWFGIIMVRMVEIGLITPPFGINLFAISKSTGVPIGTIYKGVVPFLIADALHVVFLIVVPEVVMLMVR